MSCCVGCSRIVLILISLLLLLLGFTLACLVLWFRSDPQIEPQLRQILLNTTGPSEVADFKREFGQVYLFIYWFLNALGLALAIVGFFGICAACIHSRALNAFLCFLLAILILLQVLLFLAIALNRNLIFDRLGTYMSTSFQFNLEDAEVIQTRFGCCGDGNAQASYNYQCTGLGKPNCRQILEQLIGALLALIGISNAALVALELLALALAAVLICKRKYDSSVVEVR